MSTRLPDRLAGLIPEPVRAFDDRVRNKARRIRMGPARVAESRDQYDVALEHWQTKLDRKPGDVEARLGIARCLDQLGRDDEAGELYATLLAERPDDIDVLLTVAGRERSRSALDEAERLWRAGVDLDDHRSRIALADHFLALGRSDEAEALYTAALEDRATKPDAACGLAVVAESRGDRTQADEFWGLALDASDGNAEVWSRRVDAAVRWRSVPDALALSEAALAERPYATRLIDVGTDLSQAVCDFERMAELLTMRLQQTPGNSYLRTQRALAANNLGDVAMYWSDLHTAANQYEPRAQRGEVGALADLLNVRLRQGELDEARQLLVPLVDIAMRNRSSRPIKACVDALTWLGDIPALETLFDVLRDGEATAAATAEIANLGIIVDRKAHAHELIADITPTFENRRATELRAWSLVHRGDVAAARELIDALSYPHTTNYLRALDPGPLGGLERRTRRFSAADLDGRVVALSVCRDEMDRMPQWLDHYRNLGVDHFIVVDNASTDGTTEFLGDQPDVELFHAEGHYRPTASGRRWINEIMRDLLPSSWCLIADADEFLVYPGMDDGVEALAARLDAQGAETMFAGMLDMHGERLDSWNQRRADESLGELFPYFDRRTWLIGSRHAPYHALAGGMRNLVLPKIMPESLLSKPVMVRGGRSIRHLTSHVVSPAAPADITGIFLHYKFAVDPKPRSTFSSSKGVFARILASDLATTRELELVSQHSVRYEGPEQLAELGLIAVGSGATDVTAATR